MIGTYFKNGPALDGGEMLVAALPNHAVVKVTSLPPYTTFEAFPSNGGLPPHVPRLSACPSRSSPRTRRCRRTW